MSASEFIRNPPQKILLGKDVFYQGWETKKKISWFMTADPLMFGLFKEMDFFKHQNMIIT